MTAEQQFVREEIETPAGVMLVITDRKQRLRALDWQDYEARMLRLLRLHYGEGGVELVHGRTPESVRQSLLAYLGGDLHAIDEIEVATAGTAFQRELWAALRRIPAGETVSYGELAVQLGRPRAVRAVGLANGANPIGVVVPCHRVIGADRSLTGYGGGLARKRWLLEHEGVRFERDRDVVVRSAKHERAQREASEQERGLLGRDASIRFVQPEVA
jgi:methylated-DNA-[protein]-cysteine S-methyltransferase